MLRHIILSMRSFLIIVVACIAANHAHALGLGSAGTTTDAQVEAGAVAQLAAPSLMLPATAAGGTVDLKGAIANHADNDLNLIEITSPVANQISILNGTTDISTGAEDMTTLTSLTIPGHQRIPSGNTRIRLTGLTQDLEPGMVIPLTLHFANGTTVDVNATTMLTY